MKTRPLISSIAVFTAICTTALAQTPAPAPASALAPASAVGAAQTSKAAANVPAPTPAPNPSTASSGEHKLEGTAAFYNSRLNGRKTASGQIFSNAAFTAAHNTLPFGTKIKVTNVKNNKTVVVRINDRGPTTPGRIFDLTRAAAAKLGYLKAGTAEVKAEIVAAASGKKGK